MAIELLFENIKIMRIQRLVSFDVLVRDDMTKKIIGKFENGVVDYFDSPEEFIEAGTDIRPDDL
ncbi:MAG: hypothetical protein KAJ47_04090 [Candidatus Aenigmarchaeota archaeon]|nr:hypothetical protein [Candidatus Aenigmarchaeota archaeon]